MSFSWSTFALQAVNFLVLVWLLKRFLFKPVGAIVAQRKAEIARSLEQAEAARQSAERARHEFDERRAEIEARRQGLIDRTRAELADERAKMIDAARAEIDNLKTAALTRLDEERENAAREIVGRSAQIAVRLAGRMLGQFASPRLDEMFLERVLDRLNRLSTSERAALLSQRGTDTGQLIVTTACPLDAAAESKWRAALGDHLGCRIAFAVDKELIAGAELKFPGATLHFSWRDNLADAQRELSQHEHVE